MNENDKTQVDKTHLEKTQVEEDETEVENKSKETEEKTVLKTFRGYKIIKELPATGGEADTFLIQKGENIYFLKLLYRKGINPKIDVLKKIKVLSEKLPEHIVRVYDVGFDKETGRYYEIMEYAEYGNLREAYKKLHLNIDDVIRELAEAIHGLHKHNIIHRDIKPTNVLIRKIKPLDLILTDFGISSAVMEDISKIVTTVKGTFQYSAPETFSGYFGKEVDWWSLGIIVYELLTGSNPFRGLSQQVIMHKLITGNVPIPKNINKKYQLFLKGLLTRDPKKRWGYEQIKKWLEGDLNIKVYYEEKEEEEFTHEKLKEWQAYGFTPQGAKAWKKAGLEPEEAKAFRDLGFTPDEAKAWAKVGIKDAFTARDWRDLGINPEEAAEFDKVGLGPKRVSKFLRKGLTAKKLLALIREASASPKQVEKFLSSLGNLLQGLSVKRTINAFKVWKNFKEWKGAGFTLHEAIEWRNAGFNPQEAKDWKKHGFNPQEAKSWKIYDFSPQEAKEWESYSFSPQEAEKWKKAGFIDIWEARSWKNAGFIPQKAKDWKKAGFSLQEAKEWMWAGFGPQEVKKWKIYGFSPQEAKTWKRHGFNPQETKEWKNRGFSIREAIEWKSRGFNPQEVEKWRKTIIVVYTIFTIVIIMGIALIVYFLFTEQWSLFVYTNIAILIIIGVIGALVENKKR